jgi:4-diphosphocytidyl-2-C-methyl-D-erythritol kinase
MISFPNAKINLGLHVLEKRRDGYHEIQTCLYPIELCDALEIVKSENQEFVNTGIEIPGHHSENIVQKAYDLLSQHRILSPVRIHLHKVIPSGAGLGGGSADGTFALKMLTEIFDFRLTAIQFKALTGQLGSDCPFFLENLPMIATGTGTTLEPIEIDLSGYRIELIHPEVSISTAEAYSLIEPRKKRDSIRGILKEPVESWQGNLINDFEVPIMKKYPEIASAKTELIEKGATYAAMTGSGSSVFGIFKK